jgi:hypothetical protein
LEPRDSRDDDTDEDLATLFKQLPSLVDAPLQRRGVWFSESFHVGIGTVPFTVTANRGQIISVERGPFLLRSQPFSITASGAAWHRFWQPLPEPGWHDLMALFKRGEARIDGDLQPLMANLQYIKDVLACPRQLRRQPLGSPA